MNLGCCLKANFIPGAEYASFEIGWENLKEMVFTFKSQVESLNSFHVKKICRESQAKISSAADWSEIHRVNQFLK